MHATPIKFAFVALAAVLQAVACSPKGAGGAPVNTAVPSKQSADNGRIYFFGDLVGPGVNIFSTDLDKNVLQHTADRGSRDISFSLDNNRNLAFTSNRIANRKPKDFSRPSAKRSGRPQDFNVYILKQGRLEQEAEHLASVVGKTANPETQAKLSPDGKWISFVRTVPESEQKNIEHLYIAAADGGELRKVASDDLIIGADWSNDSGRLLYSSHNYRQKKATLALYQVHSSHTQTLLELTDKNVQIDAPQWSPDEAMIAFVQHPLYAGGVRQLFYFDVPTKTARALSKGDIQVQSPVSWARDSKKILYSALVDYREYWHDEYRRKLYEGSAQIFLTDLTGKATQLTQGASQMHRQPVFSPDNKWIAYLYSEQAPGTKAVLRIMDTAGNQVDTLQDKVSGMGYLMWQ